MRPSHLLQRKFIYRYPNFGNGDRPINEKNWREEPHKIRKTSKGIGWDKSAYWFWFQAVLRNQTFRDLCEQSRNGKLKRKAYDPRMLRLFDDWGDIYRFENNFRKWFFDTGGELFCEPRLPQDVSEIRSPSRWIDDKEILNIGIPVTLTKKHILRSVKKLLNERRNEIGFKESGKPFSRAQYPIYANPEIEALEKYIRIWDLKQAGTKPPVIHEAIFGVLKAYRSSDPNLRAGARARYYSVVRRAYLKAEAMIENAAIGLFPKLSRD